MTSEITPIPPPNGVGAPGKHYFLVWQSVFEIDKKYVPIKPIGRGAYGIVCSALNLVTNEKVAIKKIQSAFDNRVDALRTLRELKLLRHLKHAKIIDLKDIMKPAWTKFKDVYLVYDLMETDMHRIITSRQTLSPDHYKYFLFQLLRGVMYLHSANVLHRDLKPGNLLINANCDLKIGDFGLARVNSAEDKLMTLYVVTRWYRAPELLLGCEKYGTPIDIWSVGCIFAELLGRKPTFPGTDYLHQLKIIVNVLGSLDDEDLDFIDDSMARQFIKTLPYTTGVSFPEMYPHADPLAIDLLQKMLVFDPNKRISVNEAMEHPYLSPLYDSKCTSTSSVQVLPTDLDVDEDSTVSVIKEMIWKEMLYYHPEASSSAN